MKRVLTLLLVCLPPPLVAAWHVVPCPAAAVARRTAFRARVRDAKPGDPLYTRFPLPRNDSQAVIDLISQFDTRYARNADAPGRIARGMRSGAFAFEIMRIADWSYARCAENAGETYFLIVIRDVTRHNEIARAQIYETGLLGIFALTPPRAGALTPLRNAPARDPQYVTTNGNVSCHPLNPCVASRDRRGIFIQHGSDSFLLPFGSTIFSRKAALQHPAVPWVSLGGDAFVAAQPDAAGGGPPRRPR